MGNVQVLRSFHQRNVGHINRIGETMNDYQRAKARYEQRKASNMRFEKFMMRVVLPLMILTAFAAISLLVPVRSMEVFGRPMWVTGVRMEEKRVRWYPPTYSRKSFFLKANAEAFMEESSKPTTLEEGSVRWHVRVQESSGGKYVFWEKSENYAALSGYDRVPRYSDQIPEKLDKERYRLAEKERNKDEQVVYRIEFYDSGGNVISYGAATEEEWEKAEDGDKFLVDLNWVGMRTGGWQEAP